jgi:hypothetical protein
MQEILITNLSWGKMEVSIGREKQRFKDCKIWPEGARAWNWDETGTEHNPGVQPADIEEILQGVDVMILACGVFGRLGVCAETETLLRERGISYYIENTKQAVALFNDLVKQGKRVGGVFHSTC